MENNIDFQNHHQETKEQKEEEQEEEEQEEEETLSLCDFPLNSEELEKKDSSNYYNRRSSSEPSDFFEFFINDFNSDDKYMSHAEDIINCGKLVPYKNQSTRYCESLPDLNPTRSNTSSRLTRSSRSLDSNIKSCRKSQVSEFQRVFSKKNYEPGFKVSKPRWYVLMFGSVKFPAEMDIRDIKNRQVRRNMFTESDGGGGGIPARRRCNWGNDLLRVLSCKSHASVAVMSSSSIPGIIT